MLNYCYLFIRLAPDNSIEQVEVISPRTTAPDKIWRADLIVRLYDGGMRFQIVKDRRGNNSAVLPPHARIDKNLLHDGSVKLHDGPVFVFNNLSDIVMFKLQYCGQIH